MFPRNHSQARSWNLIISAISARSKHGPNTIYGQCKNLKFIRERNGFSIHSSENLSDAVDQTFQQTLLHDYWHAINQNTNLTNFKTASTITPRTPPSVYEYYYRENRLALKLNRTLRSVNWTISRKTLGKVFRGAPVASSLMKNSQICH